MSSTIPATLRGRTIRALLFDLGETLWTTMYTSTATWQALEHTSHLRVLAVLQEYLPSFDPIHDASLGQRIRTTLFQMTRDDVRRHPYFEPDFIEAAVQALRSVGISDPTAALGAAVFEALRIRIPGSRSVFNDVFPTLAELQRRGYLLGIVTNRAYGGQPFQEDLQQLGFFDYFTFESTAVSADLGIRKPNPAIFHHVLRALHVAPEEAAMIGDSLYADIDAAQHLGMLTVWKPKLRARMEVRAKLLPDQSSASLSEEELLLAYAREHDADTYKADLEKLVPDIIIEHTHELLRLFRGESTA